MMSTGDSEPVFAADDNKAQWASTTLWWNGYQQLPLSAAVSNFTYDYATAYNTASGDDNSGLLYSIPMTDSSGHQWPTSIQSADNDEELYVSATPAPTVVDHPYKYPGTQSAVDYAMLECYAAVADPAAASQTPWTSVPYADTASSVSGYEICCSSSMPAISVDYCNSAQIMQYDATFGGFSMPANQFPTDVDHIRQQCDTSFDKAASTYRYRSSF